MAASRGIFHFPQLGFDRRRVSGYGPRLSHEGAHRSHPIRSARADRRRRRRARARGRRASPCSAKKAASRWSPPASRTCRKRTRPPSANSLNAARNAITTALEDKQAVLRDLADRAALAGIDVTLPARPLPPGALHPLTLIRDEAIGILRRMGFALADGPEIEDEFHCFDALNTPADHPARNEKDTFYFDSGKLLRTHTSSVQIRTMESQAAADPHHRAGLGLPPRRDRRHPPIGFQPARRPLRRRPTSRCPISRARSNISSTSSSARAPKCASARTSSPSPSRVSRST